MFKIIDMRAFARAKKVYDETDLDKRPKTPMMDLISSFKMGDAWERIRAHNEEQARLAAEKD